MATFGVAEGIAVASVIATAAGTGISMYAQQEQAKAAESAANYNYAIERQNAAVSAAMAERNAQMAQQQAQAQYQVGVNNAAALDAQALAIENQSREQARRLREENDRTKALQKARYAKSGVTSEGSPLAVMAETAGLLELGVQDGTFAADLEARNYRRAAEGERYQAEFSKLDEHLARYNEAAAKTGYAIDLNAAGVNRMARQNDAASMWTSSYGTLLTGLKGIGQDSIGLSDRYQTKKLASMTTPGGPYNPLAPVRKAKAVY